MSGKSDKEICRRIVRMIGRKPKQSIFLTPEKISREIGHSQATVVRLLGHLIEEHKLAIFSDPRDDNVYLARKTPKPILKYTPPELLALLHPRYFKRVAEYLTERIETEENFDSSDPLLVQQVADRLEIPFEILNQIIDCFVEAKAVEADKSGKLRVPKQKKRTPITYDGLRAFFTAQSLLESTEKSPNEGAISTLRKVHASHDEKSAILAVNVPTPNDSLTVTHLSELRIGHQDLDFELLEKLLEQLEKNKAMRPDVIVISGIIQGGSQYTLKSRRRALVPELKSENDQLKVAKELIDRFIKLGCLVVYNMSDDDARVIETRTVDAIQELRRNHPVSDADKQAPTFMQIDKMKSTVLWDTHFAFQWYVVFPYMLRAGRRLYSADEVQAKFGIAIEEYRLLYEAWQNLENGLPLDPYQEKVLALDCICSITPDKLAKQQATGLIICDDCELVAKLPGGKEITILNRHFFTLTSVTQPRDPTRPAREMIAQMKAEGTKIPNMVVLENYQQAFGVHNDGCWIVSTPGMHSINPKRRSFRTGVQFDTSHRLLTTRRELVRAGSLTHVMTPDGCLRVRLCSRGLMDRSDSRMPRTAVALMTDWQTGSITNRPDLQVSFMDWVMHEIMPNTPTAMFFVGDIVHGRNYPDFPNESVSIGLIRIDQQKKFVYNFLWNQLSLVDDKTLRNLKHVGIAPGNHEWNSGYPFTGACHSDFLDYLFKAVLHGRKMDGVTPVMYYDHVETSRGDRFRAWVGKAKIAGYGILVQHMFLERGAKGSGGPPVFQAKSMVDGLGEMLSDTDIVLTGHWHQPMYYILGGKLFVINGSLAGLSGFEWNRALTPTMGSAVLFLGGGEPPELVFASADFLASRKLLGYYSAERMAAQGLRSDKDWNSRHGFVRTGIPQSALQKALWDEIGKLNDGDPTKLP